MVTAVRHYILVSVLFVLANFYVYQTFKDQGTYLAPQEAPSTCYCENSSEELGKRTTSANTSLEQCYSQDSTTPRQFIAGPDIHNASQVDLPVWSEECPQSSLLSLLRRALYGSRLEARSIEVSKAERTRSFYASTQEGSQEQGEITDHTSITTLAETTATASSSRKLPPQWISSNTWQLSEAIMGLQRLRV